MSRTLLLSLHPLTACLAVSSQTLQVGSKTGRIGAAPWTTRVASWIGSCTMAADRVRIRVRLTSNPTSAFRFCRVIGYKSLLEQDLSIYRPIIHGNTTNAHTLKERETAPENHTHRWTFAVRSAASNPDSDIFGGADDLGYFIKCVTFKLHDAYSNAVRSKSNNELLHFYDRKKPKQITARGGSRYRQTTF